MNIVIISEFFPHLEKGIIKAIRGGVETRAYYLAKYLSNNNKVTVIASREPGTQTTSKIGNIEVIRPGHIRQYVHGGAILKRWQFVKSASQLISTLKPVDIIDYQCWVAYLVKKRSEIPYVATYHDVWVGRWTSFFGVSGIIGEIAERKILKMNWSKFITPSQYTKQLLIRNGIDEYKIKVVSNGIELSDYQMTNIEKYENPTICYIGRLVGYKRVNDLLQAISIVGQKIRNIKCKIIGIGPEKDNLMKLVYQLNIERNVEFLGYLENHKDVIKVLKKSHILCLPSIVEGFGIISLEAMACGVPFVSSNIAPISEVTDGGKGGLLFEPMNVNDLASKIITLLNDSDLYKMCIMQGKKLLSKYEWYNLAKDVEQIYKEVIA